MMVSGNFLEVSHSTPLKTFINVKLAGIFILLSVGQRGPLIPVLSVRVWGGPGPVVLCSDAEQHSHTTLVGTVRTLQKTLGQESGKLEPSRPEGNTSWRGCPWSLKGLGSKGGGTCGCCSLDLA